LPETLRRFACAVVAVAETPRASGPAIAKSKKRRSGGESQTLVEDELAEIDSQAIADG
jgi:hypothetical protein